VITIKNKWRPPGNVPAIRYLFCFFAVLICCVIAFLVGIVLFQDELPAPRFSGNDAFNEKARWLKTNLTPKCDVLIIGSSIALNNAAPEGFDLLYPGGTFINAGFWGASSEDSARMLKEIIPLCKPRMVLFLTYYGDFKTNDSEFYIKWDQFAEYLKGESALLAYLSNLDLSYYAKTFMEHHRIAKLGRGSYYCLQFNKYGSVNFDSARLKIEPARWNAYKTSRFIFSEVKPTMMNAVSDMARTAHLNNSQLVVVSTPMIHSAEDYIPTNETSKLWEVVRKRVGGEGGIYLHVTSMDGFDDPLFADCAHLNQLGAKKLASEIVERIQQLPK
jgi:hypothetical protein